MDTIDQLKVIEENKSIIERMTNTKITIARHSYIFPYFCPFCGATTLEYQKIGCLLKCTTCLTKMDITKYLSDDKSNTD